MSHPRSKLLLVGLITAIVAASTIGAAQAANGNDAASAHSGSLRTPRGDVGAGHSVLIYGPTLAKHRAINERKVALRLGFSVTVATKVEWSAMTAGDFGAFSVIVFGDPACKTSTDRLDAAIANQATWSAAVDGNEVVSTFDAVWHANHRDQLGPERLIANSVRFTGVGSGTGLDVSLSCYYVNADPGTPVDLLAGIGAFTATNRHAGRCDRVLVPAPDHPLVDRLTAAQLSHWGCSTHAVMDGVPAGFDTVATRRSGLPVLVAHTAT
jgi:hypothetical protein